MSQRLEFLNEFYQERRRNTNFLFVKKTKQFLAVELDKTFYRDEITTRYSFVSYIQLIHKIPSLFVSVISACKKEEAGWLHVSLLV